MELWIATSNLGKLKELKRLLPLSDLELHSQNEISAYTPPEETGSTFKENALIKARSLHAVKPNSWVIADDSGLEVEGLNNYPGVHSARYAGERATDIENTLKLLRMIRLRTPSNRKAQFCCSLLALSPSGEEYEYSALFKGNIARNTKGEAGFGYDNVFIPLEQDQTLAELGLAYKNKFSHRAMALKPLVEMLKSVDFNSL